ncbi:hypothetical protein IPC1171_32890 [Pseudomonas aeruginosa]|uniref:hypothetical protein n=1 Tax=Pseudomonas aeruginosa TaxID=287 RepID=UPI000FF8476A|nr:hypothetical protein [Pseudomonas aeruginosa]RPO80629.1 hypothetical protein IPC1171_32890 [Pseudomonas aeruginosa]
MKQLKQLFSLGKREAVIGGSLLMTSGLSMAAEGDIDTTKALAYIAGGLTAAAVTGAMFGLVALIGAAKKAQRAGT